ncbi:S8 family serine peptidase [Sphingomonas sp. IW22]|uniref:subtilisin-like serine protease QhpE n=1 Tax=Sphingomonas sp. IW22 TaxID=3242489 RepID=UPI0035227A8F
MTWREPVRVGVIDSGVHPAHPHIRAEALATGVAILRNGEVAAGNEATLDRLGHGTAVTAAIQEKALGAICVPVRVFHDALRASAVALVAAIDWCVAARVDLVNLSLGTTNAAHRPAIEAAVQRAVRAGVAVVAARQAGDEPCWPGSASGAIGVVVGADCARDGCFQLGDAFAASGEPRPIPGVPPRRNLVGISFAVANLTGLAARHCAELPLALAGADRIDVLRRRLADQAMANPASRSTIQKQPTAPTA